MIGSFHAEHVFLSNFSESPIIVDGLLYPTVEHAFQAMKTFDVKARADIAATPSPGNAKAMGRRVRLRKDWEEVKDDIMLHVH